MGLKGFGYIAGVIVFALIGAFIQIRVYVADDINEAGFASGDYVEMAKPMSNPDL